jgi:hypothetical protein
MTAAVQHTTNVPQHTNASSLEMRKIGDEATEKYRRSQLSSSPLKRNDRLDYVISLSQGLTPEQYIQKTTQRISTIEIRWGGELGSHDLADFPLLSHHQSRSCGPSTPKRGSTETPTNLSNGCIPTATPLPVHPAAIYLPTMEPGQARAGVRCA